MAQSRINDLLGRLHEEVLGLRHQTDSLTRHMWLLYVTFEDVVCTYQPRHSAEVLATSVDIDDYVRRPLNETSCNKKILKAETPTPIISRDVGLKDTVGFHISKAYGSDERLVCRCAFDKDQQTAGKVCLHRRQIESVKFGSFGVSTYSESYKSSRGHSVGLNWKNDELVRESGKEDSSFNVARRVDLTKKASDRQIPRSPGSCTSAGESASGFFICKPASDRLSIGYAISEDLNKSLTEAQLDKGTSVTRHPRQMGSQNQMRAGQFEFGGAKRRSLPGLASLSQSTVRGFESTAKGLSRHSFPTSSQNMGVRAGVRYPESDYLLAKAIPRVPSLSSHMSVGRVSPPVCSRRQNDKERMDMQPSTYAINMSFNNRKSVNRASFTSKPGNTPEMYPRQASVCRRDVYCNKGPELSERKLADDTQLSPVTISSGYESDSTPSPVQPEFDRQRSVPSDDDHTDYFSQSDTYPSSEITDLGSLRTSNDLCKSRFVRFGRNNNSSYNYERSSTGCHKQSHKLAKVTRSMYGIIHDLRHERTPRTVRNHSGDAEEFGRGCEGRVSLSPIISPEHRSRADVLTPRRESEDQSVSSDTRADDTPTPHEHARASPCSAAKERQCDISCVTQRLFNMDIKLQSTPGDETVSPSDRADDNSQREQVMREPPQQWYKVTKLSEAHSDNEHIYEVIPGDESILASAGMVSCESPKLAKWSTVVNLDTSNDNPPALPARTYTEKRSEPPIPPRCRLKGSSSVMGQTIVCDSGNQDYAVVCKKPTTDTVYPDGQNINSGARFINRPQNIVIPDNMSLDERLDCVEDSNELDLEYELVRCPGNRNTFDFSDLASETYCRLDAIQKVLQTDSWSPGDVLNFIDGIHDQHSPKTRDNIYRLLQNSKTMAKFSESLEIETKLLHMGLLSTPWATMDNDVTDSMTSRQPHYRQEIQPTYV